MDIFLDGCDGPSLLGCIDETCPAGYEQGSFVLNLKAKQSVFDAYEERIEKVSNTFINDKIELELIKSTLSFELCIVLSAISKEVEQDMFKQYQTWIEMSMTETIQTPVVEQVE